MQKITLKPYLSIPLTCLLSGCVGVSRIDYPTDWPASQKFDAGTYPTISGRYASRGELRGDGWGRPGRGGINPNEWYGSKDLLDNLITGVIVGREKSIELSQPDADTLQIVVPNSPENKQWTLRRSHGDFDCNDSGLKVSATGSLFAGSTKYVASDIMMTTVGMMVLSGGVVSNSRSFRPLDDGSLLMEVTRNGFAAHLFVIGWDTRSYVRWQRENPDSPPDAHSSDLTTPHAP